MIKKKLLQIYKWPLLSKEETNKNQKIIRDVEWDAIEPFIKKGNFLDVGCGAGYSMKKAENIGCKVFGIDPDPGGHGVGRTGSNFFIDEVVIKQAFAESIPFNESMFDTVYSSHVLEHVINEDNSLMEMKRVLKNDGILIIGMPTNNIAAINLFSNTFLNPHHRFVNFFLSPFIKTGKISFKELFIPKSHSHDAKSVFFDLKKYKISNWKNIVERHFDVVEIIKPAFYPYPEMVQWFKMKKNHKYTSSVFFICRKKHFK
jgi:SAM-dependent methyltransferase